MASASGVVRAPAWWGNDRRARWRVGPGEYTNTGLNVIVPRSAETGPAPEFVLIDDGSKWARRVVARIERVVASHSYADWDAEGASALGVNLLPASLSILSEFMTDQVALPQVVPTQLGGIAFEWHTDRASLEIEVRPSGSNVVYFRDSSTGEEWDDARWAEVRSRIGPILQQLA